MPKLSISIAVTAALLSTVACDRNKIQREARDVEEAREEVIEEQREEDREVNEAKAELKEEQAELSQEVQKEINDLEERYLKIDEDAAQVLGRLQTGGRTQEHADIEQARTTAKTRIEEARKATTADDARRALESADDALDNFERKVNDYRNV
jgi:chromosome segregation ATPase